MDGVEQILCAAAAEDPIRRAQAGAALVERLGERGVDQAVINLVRDPEDTLPTSATTLALLRRGDQTAVNVLARALSDVDEDSLVHSLDVLADVTQSRERYELLRDKIAAASEHPDPEVRVGARRLRGWFQSP